MTSVGEALATRDCVPAGLQLPQLLALVASAAPAVLGEMAGAPPPPLAWTALKLTALERPTEGGRNVR